MHRLKKVLIFTSTLLIAGFGFWSYSKSVSLQLFGNITNRVETNTKVVALTFDDGPTKNKTDEILSILDRNNVKATFFLTGSGIRKHYPEAKEIVSAGHEIGNHSYTHSRMIFKSLDFISREVQDTNSLIREIGFKGKIHFRPPYGKKFFSLPYYLDSQEMKTITWDVAPDSDLPFSTNPEKLAKYAISNVKPGSIILMHVMFQSRKNSMESIPEIIIGLKNKGYKFVTVSELMDGAGA